MSHLLCHRSVYNGHLRGPVTHTHCWALSSGDVTTYFNDLGQSWTRFELQTFRMLGTLSDRLRHRRDLRILSRTFSKSIFFISAPLTCAHSILCSWNMWYRISFLFKTILTSITKQLFEKLTKIVVNLRNINDTSITPEYKMLKKKHRSSKWHEIAWLEKTQQPLPRVIVPAVQHNVRPDWRYSGNRNFSHV